MILSFYFDSVGAKVLSFRDSKLRFVCGVIGGQRAWCSVFWVQVIEGYPEKSHLILSVICPSLVCCIHISFIFICCICCICLQGRNPRSPLPWSSVFRVTVIEGCPELGRLVFSVICPLCLPGWSLDMNILKISTPQIVPIFFTVAIIISGGYQYSKDIFS